MTAELHDQLRGQVVRGVVLAVHDAGGVQRVDVQTHRGVIRQGVEVMMPYGLISHAPAAGATVLLTAVGGDQGDMVAMPATRPASRFAAAPGEVGIHDDRGNRVHVRAGGLVEVVAATMVRATVGGVTLEVTKDRVRIVGDLVVTGDVSDRDGSMREMRDRYNGHAHGGGPGPSPTMD